MSSSPTPRSPDPLPNSTRQMLDELDALMERMLALPVNELEDGPAKLAPQLSAQVTVVESPQDPVEQAYSPVQAPSAQGKVLVGRLSAPPSYTTEVEEEIPSPAQKKYQ